MKRVIIVGGGLAGMVLAFRLHEEGIPFNLISNPALSSSSKVAAGLWNPLVFKRMTKSWMAEKLIPELHRFYSACEVYTESKFLSKRISIKPFTENHEKKLWTKKVHQDLLEFADETDYLGFPKGFENCKFTNGYGIIRESGNLYMNEFIGAGEKHFKEQIVFDDFEYELLQINNNKVKYKSLEAECIVFCEGHLVKHNPHFFWLPLKPAKGELLHIQAPELKFKNGVYNRNGFILDGRESKFIVGSTYNWNDQNDLPSKQGLAELREKLTHMLDCQYQITSHLAGVRPSSIDRRPIIGPHPKHKALYVFNGLGSKGVMLAPYFAGKLVHFLIESQPLPLEVNVERFYHLYAG